MSLAPGVIGVPLALAFVGAGGAKLAGAAVMRESATHLGVPFTTYRALGALELAGALGVAIGFSNASIGIAAASGLGLLMIGAVATHVKAGDSIGTFAPALTLGVLAAVYVSLRLAR